MNDYTGGIYIANNADGNNLLEVTTPFLSGGGTPHFIILGNVNAETNPNLFNQGDDIYRFEVLFPTTAEIDFDAGEDGGVDSEITEVINVTFGDSEGPEEALNILKAAIESEYGDSDSDSETGFIVTGPFQESDDSESDWHIDIDTNSNNNLQVDFGIEPNSGINVPANIDAFTVNDGTEDNSPTRIAIEPAVTAGTDGIRIDALSLDTDQPISTIISRIITTIERETSFRVTNESDINGGTLTITDNNQERVLGLWDITANHGDMGTGTLVFNTAVETVEGTTGNVISNVDVVLIIENESDLNLSSNVIDSDHINDDLLDRLMDHTFVKDYAFVDSRLIGESDLDSDVSDRLIVFPVKETQEIIYEGFASNAFQADDGSTTTIKLTVPNNIKSGYPGTYDIENLGDITDPAEAQGTNIILEHESDAALFEENDIIAFDSDSDSPRRFIYRIASRTLFTETYPFGGLGDAFSGNNEDIYLDKTPRQSSMVIDFDTSNVVSDIIPEPLIVQFEDSEDAIGILTTIKNTIESDPDFSDYAGFSVTTPESDSDGNFFIEIEPNFNADLNVELTFVDPGEGENFDFTITKLTDGHPDGVASIYRITGPDGTTLTTITATNQQARNEIAIAVRDYINNNTTWNASISGSTLITEPQLLTLANTIPESALPWIITADNGTGSVLDSETGDIVFGTALTTNDGADGNLRTDPEIIEVIEDDTTLDLSNDVIKGKHIDDDQIESNHIEADFLSEIQNVSQWEAYANDYQPDSDFGYPSTGGIALENFESETHETNDNFSWPSDSDVTLTGQNESEITYTTGIGSDNLANNIAGTLVNNTGATINLENFRINGSITFHDIPSGQTITPIFQVRLESDQSSIPILIVSQELNVSADGQTINFVVNSDTNTFALSNHIWDDGGILDMYLVENINAQTPFTYTVNHIVLSYDKDDPFVEVYRTPESVTGFSKILSSSAKYRGVTTSYGEPANLDYTYSPIHTDSDITVNNIPNWESDVTYNIGDPVFFYPRYSSGNQPELLDSANLFGLIWIAVSSSISAGTRTRYW